MSVLDSMSGTNEACFSERVCGLTWDVSLERRHLFPTTTTTKKKKNPRATKVRATKISDLMFPANMNCGENELGKLGLNSQGRTDRGMPAFKRRIADMKSCPSSPSPSLANATKVNRTASKKRV